MPKLSETLGAMLRDVALARVKADLFSRDASLEYARDPLLRAFPVPRAEIRSAEIEIAFAVSRAVQEEVDERGAAAGAIRERLPALRDRLLNASVRPSRSSRSLGPLSAAIGKAAAPGDAAARVDARLAAVARESEEELVRLVEAGDEPLARFMARTLAAVAREVAAEVTLGPAFQKEVEAASLEWAREVRRAKAAAVDRLRDQAFSLDLAVTAEELAKVPDSATARVRVVVELGNYEWVESEDEDGRPADRLVER